MTRWLFSILKLSSLERSMIHQYIAIFKLLKHQTRVRTFTGHRQVIDVNVDGQKYLYFLVNRIKLGSRRLKLHFSSIYKVQADMSSVYTERSIELYNLIRWTASIQWHNWFLDFKFLITFDVYYLQL